MKKIYSHSIIIMSNLQNADIWDFDRNAEFQNSGLVYDEKTGGYYEKILVKKEVEKEKEKVKVENKKVENKKVENKKNKIKQFTKTNDEEDYDDVYDDVYEKYGCNYKR